MRILSWNIKQFNFAPNKSYEEQQFRIHQIAAFIADCRPDIVAIMEIRPGTSKGSVNEQMEHSQGALATEQLMSYIGGNMRVAFSGINAVKQPTAGELYAFIYNPATVELIGSPTVVYHDADAKLSAFKNRAPAFGTFAKLPERNVFSVAVFHAPKPSDMNVTQIQELGKLGAFDFGDLILCGDFNMSTENVGKALPGFSTAIGGEGTSLRVNPDGHDNAYDAIFYLAGKHLQCTNAGVLNPLEIVDEATSSDGLVKQEISAVKRYTSDHAGVYADFTFVP
ncbi:exonuclease/endonuclease/phosphatase family protein [Paraburkholderia bannensis]|uniref:hypothetical protein n=1 Tax=Paraburkholderia bannensis TaxID=765414 RepID=UPI002AB7BF35|nr:hypothetical protein [Paraburkholderia bannensis]